MYAKGGPRFTRAHTLLSVLALPNILPFNIFAPAQLHQPIAGGVGRNGLMDEAIRGMDNKGAGHNVAAGIINNINVMFSQM